MQRRRRFMAPEVWSCFVAIGDHRDRRGPVVTIGHRPNVGSTTVKICAADDRHDLSAGRSHLIIDLRQTWALMRR
jgi:hypothetical protein